jgi:hypothetical protein
MTTEEVEDGQTRTTEYGIYVVIERGRMRGVVRRRPPSLATCAEVLMFPYHSRHILRCTTCIINDGRCANQYKVALGVQSRRNKERGMGKIGEET